MRVAVNRLWHLIVSSNDYQVPLDSVDLCVNRSRQNLRAAVNILVDEIKVFNSYFNHLVFIFSSNWHQTNLPKINDHSTDKV